MLHILRGMLIRKGNFVLHFVTEACYSYMHDTKINNFAIIIYKLLEHVGNCNQMVKDSCRFACVSWWHFCTSFRRDTCSDLGHMQTLIYIFSTTQTTMKTGKIKITVSPDIAAETQASTTQTTMKPVTDQSEVDMFQKVLNHVVKIFRFWSLEKTRND